eukprot:SAG31_NODE_716_length_12626_cov_7.493973_5_plen_69_part_00
MFHMTQLTTRTGAGHNKRGRRLCRSKWFHLHGGGVPSGGGSEPLPEQRSGPNQMHRLALVRLFKKNIT